MTANSELRAHMSHDPLLLLDDYHPPLIVEMPATNVNSGDKE